MQKATTEQQLEQLDTLFHWSDLVRVLGYTKKSARVMVCRWAKAGVIESIGGNSGLYRVVSKPLERPLWSEVIKIVCPECLVTGLMSLHLGGWLKERPEKICVAKAIKRRPPALEPLVYQSRPKRWFDRASVDGKVHGISVLDPLWALADLQVNAPRTLIELDIEMPDDVTMSQVLEVAEDIRRLNEFRYRNSMQYIYTPTTPP